MSASRSDHLALGYSSHPAAQNRSGSPSMSVNASLIDSLASSNRQAFGIQAGISPGSKMAGSSRSGTGSPSHEMSSTSSRLSFKRAREIQAQEGISGLPLNMWSGPPTSGNSTPLRENIPESPTDDFPDFAQLPTPETIAHPRRTRAGTLPSRLGGVGNGLLAVKSARGTPSPNPFNKSPSPNSLEPHHERLPQAVPSSSASAPGGVAGPPSTLYSRLRAGSMPQRSPFASLSSSNSPFGPSIFSSWNPSGVGRERGSTLASIASVGSNAPSSPAQSQFSKEGAGDSDVHMRTLDYLGLAETPQPVRATLATPYIDMSSHASRFRSYSVNNQDKYADEYDDTPTLERLQEEIDATNQAIHNHNLAVQAFASQASRPRARTAGVLDTPGSHLMRTYVTGVAGVPGAVAPAEIRLHDEDEVVYDGLSQAVAGLNIGRTNSRNAGLLSADEQGLEGPTSALWLGGIPTSTTTSTLIEMFKSHGPIVSARVLTHKNCGFVNFERVESAISAKASMNGKEIFPGAGPIRINFAKPPSASETPGHDGAFPSPSPDPFGKAQDASRGGSATPSGDVTPGTAAAAAAAAAAGLGNVTPTVPPLREMTADIVEIVGQFGATDEDRVRISQSLQSAIQYTSFAEEIPPVREPTHTRVHDAPKLRDIRKRIDNQMLSRHEIENVALEMLPEIAELSSDYLGNTVVQKLFDHCSDPLRDAMLREICPHLAEIGIHKNGTWAAQKIIDVCKTPTQLALIVEHLRPYTVPLFLDQYGNYVLQGCLKFGSPYNDFIFETMLSQMWEIAQGRFGARAMRACLESHHATKEQQRMLAAAIALHSVQLATNANGALLLTWFLDTCTFPNRRTVLSPRLVPHLVHLCTHKVAYLTVLKVINQKAEADARDTILKALFFSPNDQILEAILNDQACGATLIFKVLTTPFFDEAIRGQVVENVKSVLLRIKAQPGQGYKRLMDEVGLSTRAAGSSREASASAGNTPSGANAGAGVGVGVGVVPEQRQRPGSRHTNATPGVANGPQSLPNKPFYNNGNAAPVNTAAPFDPAGNDQRMDNGNGAGHAAFPPYNQGMMYNPSGGPGPGPGPVPVPMAPAVNLQQLQYQQNVMGRGNPPPPMSYPYPAMQPGFGYGTQTPPMEPYRPQNGPNGNAMQPHPPPPPPQMAGGQPPHAPPGFGMGMGMGMGGYGYAGNMAGMPPNMGGYMQGPPPPQPQQQQQQQQQQQPPQEQSNGRRGRGRHGQRDQRQGGQR